MSAWAQLNITGTSTNFIVDFDNTMMGVNNGAFISTSGADMFAATPADGQLSSSGWALVKDGTASLSIAPAVFPGTGTANFNTVTSSTGTSSTGWGAWNLNGDHAFAILPSGANASAGTMTLAVVNNTGVTANSLHISYLTGAFNDQPRSNKVDFLYSFNNVTYDSLPDLSYVSGAASTSTWEIVTRDITLNSVSIPNGSTFYLRWFFNDVSGSGSRDEFILDDISVSVTGGGAPTPVQLAITTVNGGIEPSATEGFSMTVQAQDANGTPANVLDDTDITLSVNTGTGILGGTITETILAGSNSVVVNNLTYSVAENGVKIAASATGLTTGISAAFDVLAPADRLLFMNVPDSTYSGDNLVSAFLGFQVIAQRPDYTQDYNYTGDVTVQSMIGPGQLLGTTTRPAIGGVATFNDIRFTEPGLYILMASSGTLLQGLSPSITVLQGPSMKELVVPKYIGSKTAASANNARTPFAVCLQFEHLLPETSYNIKVTEGVVTEPLSSFGAGNICPDTIFSQNIVYDAFTTDIDGNYPPYWVFLQPTGNATRYDAGQVHNLRVGIIPSGGTFALNPTFVGSKAITALDIPLAARTASTLDDGAFLYGKTDTLLSGKYFLLYNNVDGTGDPLYAYQIRKTRPYNYHQSELPGVIDSIWMQVPYGVRGDFAAIIPVGSNNPNGIRRLEARNEDNTIFSYQTDADGIWPSGANTTAPVRRDVLALTYSDVPLVATISGQVTYANTDHTPIDSTVVSLLDGSKNIVMQTTTDENGHYFFKGMNDGTYTLSFNSPKKWGGGNAIDALLILKHFVNMVNLIGIYRQAADVSGDTPPIVNANDALLVQKRFVELITTFSAGDWVFEPASVTITNAESVVKNVKSLCRGDVTGDYIPY